FAGHDPRVGCLLGHNGSILLQLLEETDCRRKIRGRAPEREIDCHRTHIAHGCGGRVEIANHAAIVRLEQILPACGYGLSAERVLVDEEPERAGMNGGPVTVRILQPGRYL